MFRRLTAENLTQVHEFSAVKTARTSPVGTPRGNGSELANPRTLCRAALQDVGQTCAGTTNGLRYSRVNIRLASESPVHSIFFASQCSVRPSR